MPTSWADDASESVKADLAALLNAALDVVASTLDQRVAPAQFLILMDLEGQLTARLGYAHATVGDLVEPFLDDHASLRAVLCVRRPGNEAAPTLLAFGDHREGAPFDCRLDWRRVGGSPPLRVTGFEVSPSSWWLFE